MTSLRKMGARFGMALLGAGTLLAAAPGQAQTAGSGGWSERPDDVLSRNLRLLAANPKSLTALMAAGRSALDLGDPQAALTFFARAEEVAPRDGRIKMWIGAALVQMQQPRAALKFFSEATGLGVPDAEVAKDRGLAHDIAGNPRAAQRDYRVALQRGRDDEVTRRLALSLAISGEREPALRLLEDQLLVRDRAGERARTMVLALTGDSAGASRAAQASMPGAQANAMSPFLARLASLGPTEKALAVHLGVFPGDGRTAPPASTGTYASNSYASPSYTGSTPSSSSPVTDAGKPSSSLPSLARRTPEPAPATSQRRSDGEKPSTAPAVTARAEAPKAEKTQPAKTEPTRIASVESSVRRRSPAAREAEMDWARGGFTARRRAADAERKLAAPVRKPEQKEAKPAPVAAAPAQAEPKPAASAVAIALDPPAAETNLPEPKPAETSPAAAAPGFSTIAAADLAPSIARPAEETKPAEPVPAASGPTQFASLQPGPSTAQPASSARLADLTAVIETVAEPAAKPAAKRPAAAATAKPKPAAPAAVKKPAAPAEPARTWVQVAGGANKAGLPREFARLKAKAPKLLGAHAAWTAPLNATNRLLVGPFAGTKEAQAFVNQLKEQDIPAFAWTSEAGEKIEKLPAK